MKAEVLSLYGLAKSQKKGWKVREVGVGVGQVLGYGQLDYFGSQAKF